MAVRPGHEVEHLTEEQEAIHMIEPTIVTDEASSLELSFDPTTPHARQTSEALRESHEADHHVDEQEAIHVLRATISTGEEPMPNGKVSAAPEDVEPFQLQRSWLSSSIDLTFIIIPLLFIILVIETALLDNKKTSSKGRQLQDLLLLMPTIFPIVFAAICGRAMKSMALYKSQSGLQMRQLEHMAGTQSLFSALERLWLLKNFGVIGFTTTLLWLLSPLCGQALLRLIDRETAYAEHHNGTTYLGPSILNYTQLSGASSFGAAITAVTAVYLSSLTAPANIRASPRDLWGNLKIPSARYVRDCDIDEGWIPTPSDLEYSGLIGIPLGADSEASSSQFIISATSMDIHCSSLAVTGMNTFRDSLEEPLLQSQILDGGGTYPNGTTDVHWQKGASQPGNSTSFLYLSTPSWVAFQQNMSSPIKFYYGSFSQLYPLATLPFQGQNTSLATCTAVPITLQMNVTCASAVCQVKAFRKTELMGSFQDRLFLTLMNDGSFCGMGASSHPFHAGMTERFLADPDRVIGASKILMNLWNETLSDFELRFALAFNTFWYASASSVFVQGISSVTTDSGEETPEMTGPGIVEYDLGPGYQCNWVWICLSLLVLLVLELIALANAILRFRTHVPDVFGYVSSLTLGNPFCERQGLKQSSALDGLERARRLGDVRFRLAEMGSGLEPRRIAFVPVGNHHGKGSEVVDCHGEGLYQKVKFGRWYH